MSKEPATPASRPRNNRRAGAEEATPKAHAPGRLRRALGAFVSMFKGPWKRPSFDGMGRGLRTAGQVIPVVLALAAAGAVGRLAERHVRKSPAFALRIVQVEGEERLSEADVVTIAGLRVGQNVFDVPPEDALARLVGHPWIAQAEVRRRLPGTFEIVVRERKPAALLVLDHVYLIGQDATVFKQVASDDPIDLPVVTGVEPTRFLADRGYRAALLLEIVAMLHDYRAAGLERREPIQEIHVSATGTFEIYIGSDATLARLGRGPFLAKLRKLRRILDALDQRDARPAYVYLDNVRRPDRVTVRLREISAPVAPPAEGTELVVPHDAASRPTRDAPVRPG
jgi:cell division protein FtsQ